MIAFRSPSMTSPGGDVRGDAAATSPVVSVIIATYNRSETLALALQSVLAQTFAELEVWVIGDCCTDNSETTVLACGDPRVHWYNRERNSGSQGAPNNDGLARAKGTYVAYLGHDDLWFPWHLTSLVRRLEETGADGVSGLGLLFGPEGVRGAAAVMRESERWYSGPPSCFLHRRDISARAGGWPDADRVDVGVDDAFWRRLDDQGARFEVVPRLSVLKFPSAWCGGYASRDASAQQKWWARIAHDPRTAEHQALSALALMHVGWSRSVVPSHLPELGRAVVRALVKLCTTRLPTVYNSRVVTGLRVRKFQRLRRHLLRARGLKRTRTSRSG
ncbi:MAG TPA: glycosyltransferase family 2 protein [Bradyrhizobium sp.]|nr:glycosyltransferase family 2 protein [Bradyrhizobium sp.]